MTTVNIDKIRMRVLPAIPGAPGLAWRGPWFTATNYVVGDAVYYDGSSYICTAPHKSGVFATDKTSNWDLLASGTPEGPGFGGDMQVSVYDEDGIEANVFDMSNMLEGDDALILSNSERTKLDSVEVDATGDQTGEEIKAAYEAEADTNAFTDGDSAKLGHLSVTQAVDLDFMAAKVAVLDAAVVLVGGWDASTGSFPGSGAAQLGYRYIVTAGGVVDGETFQVDEHITALVDNASTGTYSPNWLKSGGGGQSATQSAAGIVELATNAEAQAGADALRALTPANLTAKEATTAEIRNNTADRILTTDQFWAALAEVVLADASTISVNMSTMINGRVTLAGNRTLGNPTSVKECQTGYIKFTQDGTGGRTLLFGDDWVFPGGVIPTLSAGAGDIDLLNYRVLNGGKIFAEMRNNIGAEGGGSAEMSVRFIRPTLAGTGDGSSWENASGLSSLNTLIGQLSTGGIVYVRIDEGDYAQTSSIAINNSGQDASNRVDIVGVDVALNESDPALAKVVGTRTPWTLPVSEPEVKLSATGFGGNTLFDFANGCDFLHFRNLFIEHTKRPFDFTGVTATGLEFTDVTIYNCRDGYYSDHTTTLTDTAWTRPTIIGLSKKGIRIHGNCSNITITDPQIDSGWQDGDAFAVCIELNDDAHDINIVGSDTRVGFTRNCSHSIKNGSANTGYWNGDGISSERGNYNINITDIESYGHTDGGVDLKSEFTTLTRVECSDNKRNYRIWGGLNGVPIRMIDCVSYTPNKRGGTGSPHDMSMGDSNGTNEPGAFAWATGMVIDQTVGPEEATGVAAFGLLEHNNALIMSDATITLGTGGSNHAISQPSTSDVLYGTGGDAVDPVITNDYTIDAVENSAQDMTFTSSESTVGLSTSNIILRMRTGKDGLDANDLNAQGPIVINQNVLTLATQVYGADADANADGVYEADVEVWDADGNNTAVTAQYTVTPLVFGDFPLVLGQGSFSGSAASGADTDKTVALPAGITNGDLVLLVGFVNENSVGFTQPEVDIGGWSLIAFDSNSERLFVWGKVITDAGSEVDPTITFHQAESNDQIMVKTIRIANFGGSPVYENVQSESVGFTNSFAGQNLTTSGTNRLGIQITAFSNDKSGITLDPTFSWAQLAYHLTTSGSDGTLYIMTKELAAAGSHDVDSISWGGSAIGGPSVSFAIKPV